MIFSPGARPWIDAQGRLQVGPRSAGSTPGPVAFRTWDAPSPRHMILFHARRVVRERNGPIVPVRPGHQKCARPFQTAT